MPTFADLGRDAEESRQAMRAVAHQRITADDLEDLYGLLGTLNATARSLQQVLQQVAVAHRDHAEYASTDNDDPGAGHAYAMAVHEETRHAADLLEAVQNHLDTAQQHAGRVVWWPPTPNAPEPRPYKTAQRREPESSRAARLEHLNRFAHGPDGLAPDPPGWVGSPSNPVDGPSL